MYKVKIIFLTKQGGERLWTEQWVDADNLEGDNLDAILTEYSQKEQDTINSLHIAGKVIKTLIGETHDITDGRYLCDGCGCYCDKPNKGGYCPFCDCPVVIDTLGIDKPKSKKCFNHCPKCDATDPDIEWGEKDWLDKAAYQSGTCKKCGCEFKEYYEYTDTEIDGEQ